MEMNKAGLRIKRDKPNKHKCVVLFCNKNKAKRDVYCPKHKRRNEMVSSPEQVYYGKLKLSALRRGIRFTITLADFKEFCRETDLVNKKKTHPKGYWHIDRAKNNIGYCHGNLALITYRENTVKSHTEDKYILADDPFAL